MLSARDYVMYPAAPVSYNKRPRGLNADVFLYICSDRHHNDAGKLSKNGECFVFSKASVDIIVLRLVRVES